MPKIKTHSGAKKRFALTKNGKVKRAHAGKRHLLNKFAELCTEVSTLDKAAKLEGRNMSIFLSPKAGK